MRKALDICRDCCIRISRQNFGHVRLRRLDRRDAYRGLWRSRVRCWYCVGRTGVAWDIVISRGD